MYLKKWMCQISKIYIDWSSITITNVEILVPPIFELH